MILFLDTVSSLPEFSLIEDNKIIHTYQILSNQDEKMSDLLIPSYFELDKKFNFDSNLQLLLINTGPASYTALRIGIAFFSGLSLSKNISLIGIPCIDLFRFVIPNEELISSAIYISSSMDQNFICFFDIEKNTFKINKIEKNVDLHKQGIDLKKIKRIYTNGILQTYKKKLFEDMEIRINQFSDLVNKNIKEIKNFKKNEIILPIYSSNNKILN